MNEDLWLACTNPRPMLEFVVDKSSGRHLRLFGCACCRRMPAEYSEPWQDVIEAVERFADGLPLKMESEGLTSRQELSAQNDIAHMGVDNWDLQRGDREAAYAVACLTDDDLPAWIGDVAAAAADSVAWASLFYADSVEAEPEAVLERTGEFAVQAHLLRCIVGNPYRPVTLDPACRTPTVVALARAAYGKRIMPGGILDPERLAVLADAL
jgi:hypothetical protein